MEEILGEFDFLMPIIPIIIWLVFTLIVGALGALDEEKEKQNDNR